MLEVARLRGRVQVSLDGFLRTQADLLAETSPDLVPLVDAVAAFLAGGKLLRPAFCYWGWRGAGGDDSDAAVTAAASLELFQAAALIHDDLMDDSDSRRGQPSIHRRFAALHEASGWSGPSASFGRAGAILLGDLTLVWNDEMLMRSGLPVDALLRARPTYELMRTQLMGGQFLDVLEQARGEGTVESARQVIRFKSAKYSVEHPLLIGGLLADASPELLTAYSAYGLPLGEAFQLRDDVLGVFGDPGETGKPAGDDLREGKRTVLVAHAFAKASRVQADVLAGLGDRSLGAADVEAMRTVIVETGALAAVEQTIDELVDEARDALAAADVDEAARDVLGALVDAATARTT